MPFFVVWKNVKIKVTFCAPPTCNASALAIRITPQKTAMKVAIIGQLQNEIRPVTQGVLRPVAVGAHSATALMSELLKNKDLTCNFTCFSLNYKKYPCTQSLITRLETFLFDMIFGPSFARITEIARKRGDRGSSLPSGP